VADKPDVRWNHTDADAAVRALRAAARMLRTTRGDRQRAAQDATEEWRGKYRDEFDQYLRWVLYRAENLAGRYEDAARSIVNASEEARKEQARRERAREEK
jgi:hypothetical protein